MLTSLQKFLTYVSTYNKVIFSVRYYKLCLSVMTLSIFNLHYIANGNIFPFVAENLYIYLIIPNLRQSHPSWKLFGSSRILWFKSPNFLVPSLSISLSVVSKCVVRKFLSLKTKYRSIHKSIIFVTFCRISYKINGSTKSNEH